VHLGPSPVARNVIGDDVQRADRPTPPHRVPQGAALSPARPVSGPATRGNRPSVCPSPISVRPAVGNPISIILPQTACRCQSRR
jgi:hypothetical protein